MRAETKKTADARLQNHKNTNKKPRNILKWFAILATIFFIFFAIAIFASYSYKKSYTFEILSGTSAGNVYLGGKTQKEALILLNEKKDFLLRNGILFFYQEKKAVIPSEILSSDPDLAKTIISIDTQKAVREAYSFGRKGGLLQKFSDYLSTFFQKRNIVLDYTIDEPVILGILKTEFQEFEEPGRDAQLDILGENISLLPEKEGKIFDYDAAIARFHKQLAFLENDPIEMRMIVSKPKIFAKDVQFLLPKVHEIIATTTPELVYEDKKWRLTKDQFSQWLGFGFASSQTGEKELRMQMYPEKLELFLNEISKEINTDFVDAKFELIDGRVTQFQASRNGRKLNIESSSHKINKQFFENGVKSIQLIVEVTLPKIATEDVNNLGIKELLGVGKSNFKGSPKNRKINIANGARLLNGLLIKPGEEFSLLKALAPFDGSNGYLQELVIKGNRTIPEYGGGLCQIGTTIFRATLYSGLPITQRKNHSYRVIYYEPAGMDATIYDPAPDYKFKNDTAASILITTEIQGDELIFKFYGTSDGRKVEVTKPKIYNITAPGEPRFIETEEIPPGEKKLVEKPHAGADTEFDYTVIYPDGRHEKKTFYSHYVAWREAWLVGKTLDENAGSATTTDTIQSENITNSFN